MPQIMIRGCSIYYEMVGPEDAAETVLFSHGLLWSGDMFRAQVDALQGHFRVVCYDHRGQGRSQITASGYDMDSLTLDAVALIDALRLGSVHFVGLSMGGFVGMRLAARHSALVRSMVLLDTSADPEVNQLKYKALVTLVKLFGVRALVGQVMPVMFGQTFLRDPARRAERAHWREVLARNPKTIIRAVAGVISRQGVIQELCNISCPTLVVTGAEDTATVPAKARRIANHIPQAELHLVPGAGHSSTIETPEAINTLLLEFLGRAGG